MNDLVLTTNDLTAGGMTLGQAANEVAAQGAFDDYRTRKAANTVRRQDADLKLFARYLAALGEDCDGPFTQPEAWSCVTWGLVSGFIKWQLHEGYSVSSVNVRLSTVKTYSKLALKAGTLGLAEYAMIRTVSGYRLAEAINIDASRIEADLPTRYGSKKAEPTVISRSQADMLKSQPDTPQSRRDALLMCILLDHGLRCGEAALLTCDAINLAEGTLTFFRPKVKARVERSHAVQNMSLQTSTAAKAYFEKDAPQGKNEDNKLLLGSHKSGNLSATGINERSIYHRVKVLGQAVGVEKLSPHDLRHHCATKLAKSKSIDELMDIFGWNSPAMAIRYIQSAQIVDVE